MMILLTICTLSVTLCRHIKTEEMSLFPDDDDMDSSRELISQNNDESNESVASLVSAQRGNHEGLSGTNLK